MDNEMAANQACNIRRQVALVIYGVGKYFCLKQLNDCLYNLCVI